MSKRNRKSSVKAAKRKAAALDMIREGDWGDHLATLRQALEERKPDALQRIRSEIMTLEDQVQKLKRQSELVPKSAENQQAGFERGEQKRHEEALAMLAKRRGNMPALVAVKVAKLAAEIDARAARSQDLTTLVGALKAEPFAQDYGGTPETVTKARDWLVVYHAKGFRTGPGTFLRISSIQRDAGQRLALAFDRMQVSLKSCLNDEAGSGNGSPALHGLSPREKAACEYKDALGSMWLVDSSVVVSVAVQGMSVQAWAKSHNAPEEQAFKALDRGLSALASHYRLDTHRISA